MAYYSFWLDPKEAHPPLYVRSMIIGDFGMLVAGFTRNEETGEEYWEGEDYDHIKKEYVTKIIQPSEVRLWAEINVPEAEA